MPLVATQLSAVAHGRHILNNHEGHILLFFFVILDDLNLGVLIQFNVLNL